MKILAVDDDTVARMAIRGMVNALGHECVVARDGAEAWQLVERDRFDVVITDRVMPDMNGLELCRRIRSRPADAGYAYVVLASALGQSEEKRDGMVAGADDYLTKPLRIEQLERKLIAAERVTQLHRELTDVNQLQADVMSMLSHDARQPLAAIIGYTEACVDDLASTPPELLLPLLVKSLDAARRLDQLIQDVLTMGRLESGKISSSPGAFAAGPIIHDAVVAAAGQTPVAITGAPDTEVYADQWHLRQVLTNLIGNAVKYGTPPIEVAVRAEGEHVLIEVGDAGEGVPVDFVPRLFDRFTRADTGIATQKPGTGFGLYIVRRLIEADHGTIAYRPGTPTGACFAITLPRP